MTAFVFGAGNMWGTPLTDSSGNAIAVPTPIKFGTLQDISVDIQGDIKELYGQNQFPVDVSRGKGKISIKAKAAQINGETFNSIFFGQTLTTGQTVDYVDTTGAAIPATPFQITPTVPGSGTWSADLGVKDSTGLVYTRVATGPTTGQYSVAAGVYTFATADTGKTVFIDYQYTLAAVGKSGTILNQPMGYAPVFQVDMLMQNKGKTLIWTFPQCISTKLSFATKLDDYMVPEFDISAFANGAGQIVKFSATE